MAARGVVLDDVRAVLDNPQTTWRDPRNHSKVYLGTATNGKTLKVCLVDPAPPDGVEVVKTVMWV